MESCVLVSSHPKPKAPLALDPSALLAITVAPKIQNGGTKTLSQGVNSFIYLSLLQSAQRVNVSRGGGGIQHLTISTIWDFIGALLLLLLPRRHQGHEDTEGQRDWPPFTRVVKVDKLAADRREKKAARQPRSHFPKCLLPIHSLRLLSLPAFGRTRPRVTLMHGAAVLQGPGKVCLHLGDFPIPESHRVAVKKKTERR